MSQFIFKIVRLGSIKLFGSLLARYKGIQPIVDQRLYKYPKPANGSADGGTWLKIVLQLKLFYEQKKHI